MSKAVDQLLSRVLRTSPEPYCYFDEAAVHRRLTRNPLEYLRFVRSGLAEIAAGRRLLEMPPKQVFADPGSGDFRVMPCVVRSAKGVVKTVKIVGTNARQQNVPDQVTVGKAVALHPEENFITDIFEACLLSSARTGVCAALAIDLLAASRPSITIIGAGRVGYYSAVYAAALGKISEICFSDQDPARARQTVAALRDQCPSVRFTAKRSGQTCHTDVLVLATTSSRPLSSPSGLQAPLVVSLGADTDNQSELDKNWAGRADIFIDSRDSLRFGDLNAWITAGLVNENDIVDLLALLRNGLMRPSNRPRLFISTGSALFDNLTIGYILKKRNPKQKSVNK